MITKTAKTLLTEKRGSAIITVFVITTSIVIMLGAILSHSMTERRINARHELRLEAKNASEAIAEYAFAQLRYKFESRTNFLSNSLAPGSGDALGLPVASIFGSTVDYAKSSVYGGTIGEQPSTLTFIDPNNPANEFDPLRGQKVYARRVGIYAKATVNDPRGGPSITNYVSQKLQVRDAPLFSHAIFYNLDLEVSPGPKMEIHGPVHTNGDLYLQGISGVDFHYPTSTAGDMFYGWGTTEGEAQGASYESLQTGDVKFKNREGDLVSFIDDGDDMNGDFMDSNYSDWREYASNRWNGNLLTQEHGVQIYTPVAFSNYIPDDPAIAGYNPVNSGHAIIEPAINEGETGYDEEIEKQKIATQAGLVFEWDATTSTVQAFNKSGTELDISHLVGSGSENLWQVRHNQFFDHRRNQLIDIVEFNVGKLKQLIESPDYGVDDDFIDGYNPSSDWNGIVYFEVTSSTDPDHLNNSGIRLWGGCTDPNLDGQGIPSLDDIPGKDPGMTFASNNAVYIRGHFNADGQMHGTNTSNNSAVVPETDEVPVAIFGDSVTILSRAWEDNQGANPAAKSTEIAAAIVSGIIPSNAGGNLHSSGGVHNFPRFLERWKFDNIKQDLYIRGSLVCLYESEVDNSLWAIDYYGPPGRKWGFSELFLDGVYPPGTPLLRTYRRIDYTNLSESEYNSAIASLPWNNGAIPNEGESVIIGDADEDEGGGGNDSDDEVVVDAGDGNETPPNDPPANDEGGNDNDVVVDNDDPEDVYDPWADYDDNWGNGWGNTWGHNNNHDYNDFGWGSWSPPPSGGGWGGWGGY